MKLGKIFGTIFLVGMFLTMVTACNLDTNSGTIQTSINQQTSSQNTQVVSSSKSESSAPSTSTNITPITAGSDNEASSVFSENSNQVTSITRSTDTSIPARDYTITFKNYDNSILDTILVKEGTIPSYTGSTPIKPSDDNYKYIFDGWDSELSKVTGDKTYTATYTQIELPPYILSGNKIYFGSYPQTLLDEEASGSLIAELNESAGEIKISNGWVDYGYYIDGKVESYMF